MNTYVDYLITGFGCGQTKLKKAKDYRITVIDSSKFFN
jgi:NAD-dependent DNA ligase